MEYKVGDRVKIKSIDWYNANKDERGMIKHTPPVFTETMSRYCGQVFTITKVYSDETYDLDVYGRYLIWEKYMFEDRICNYAYRATKDISHNKKIIEYLESLGGVNTHKYTGYYNHTVPFYYFIDIHGHITGVTEACINTDIYELKEFEEQNMMEERTIKLSLGKAKEWYNRDGELKEVALQAYSERELIVTELPKTWEECCKQLDRGEHITTDAYVCYLNGMSNVPVKDIPRNMIPRGTCESMLALCKLLVCRDVYRQGWKPYWVVQTIKYTICNVKGEIRKDTAAHYNSVLSFQDSKTKDEFFENFRDLIEKAKELI